MNTMRLLFMVVVVGCAATIAVLSVGLTRQANANHELARQGAEAHDVLCVDKAALERDVRRTAQILKDNRGPVIFGFPRELLERSLKDARADLGRKRHLDCT